MYYLAVILLGALTGVSIAFGLLYVNRKSRRRHEFLIEIICGHETAFERHVRHHVLSEKDWSWAEGVSPIATFGIKEDFTLLTDEELNEARKMAGIRNVPD